MIDFTIHISPLDDDNEFKKIKDKLKNISKNYRIEKPTDETNALIIPVEIKNKDYESWKLRDEKIKKMIKLLEKLDIKFIKYVKSIGLSANLKIYTDEFAIPLPLNLLKECSRLGIDIYIINIKKIK